MKTFLFLFLTFLFTPATFAQSATVTWTTAYQTMVGFGAQGWQSNNPFSLTSAQADLFYSTSAGIGLAVYRSTNIEDDTSPYIPSFSSLPDVVSLPLIVARAGQVVLEMSSPPIAWKYTGSWANGAAGPSGTCLAGTGATLSTNYQNYANYTVSYIQMLQSNGIPISYLSMTNEPDYPSSSLGACAWTAATIDTYVSTYLGPAMTAARLTTKLIIDEDADWFSSNFTATCLNDSNCSPYVSVIAAHGYGNGNVDGTGVSYCCATATPQTLPLAQGKQVWMTEVNGGYAQQTSCDTNMWVWDPSMNDALWSAHNIHDYLTVANASEWNYWELNSYDTCGGTLAGYNDGYTDHNFNPAKRYYTTGNWSKYVRPGWVRIDATVSPTSGTYITAFKETSSGSFAIVAVNQNSSPVNVNFSLSEFPSVTSVTPTLTSASVNLVDQASTSVSGSAFSYALPATSVVTFHGTASSGSSPTPAPPTDLTATVH
jgi:glucuronoarabinoxylan endo-1,4-beta-xylanase